MMQKPEEPASVDQRAFIRSSSMLLAVIAGVALCVKAGAPLLIPATFLVALLALERPNSMRRYLFVLSSFIAVAVAIGVIWALMTHASALGGLLVACGLIFATLGRLRKPSSEAAASGSDSA